MVAQKRNEAPDDAAAQIDAAEEGTHGRVHQVRSGAHHGVHHVGRGVDDRPPTIVDDDDVTITG